MAVKLVIFDCDLTLWDHPNVSGLRLPLVSVDEDTVADADGVQVRLLPGVREVLGALQATGIVISIASWNRPEHVFAITDLLGLTHFFVRPMVEFHPYKERTVVALVEQLAADGLVLRPEEIVYVDDRPAHLRRVRAAVGPIRTLRPGVDFASLAEILPIIASPADIAAGPGD